MKSFSVFKRIMAILLVLCFVFGVVGCRRNPGSGLSEYSYYSNFEDGDTEIVNGGGGKTDKPTGNSGGAAGSGGSAGGSTGTTSTGNSKKNKNQVSMLTWWDFSESEKERKSAWEKKTGTTVKLIKTTQGLYSTKLASLVMADNAPDLACLSNTTFPSFINKSLLIPLNDYIDVNDSRLAIEPMEAAKFNGKYYGMDVKGSQFTHMSVVYYNKTLMESWGVEKNPTQLWNEGNWNWDTFLELAQYMTGTKGGKTVTGFSVAAASYWEYWSVSTGTSMVGYDPATSTFKNNFSHPDVIKGWEFAIDLLKTYKCAKEQGNIIDGNVAMTGGGDWYMWKGDVYDEKMKDEWSAVPWPSPKGMENTVPCTINLWGLCNGGPNPEKAVDYLFYFLDPTNSKKEVYASKELEEVHNKLWNMKKNFTWAKGPISYSNVNAYDSLMKKLYQGDKGAITSTLNSNSSALDANIKLIEKDKVDLSK